MDQRNDTDDQRSGSAPDAAPPQDTFDAICRCMITSAKMLEIADSDHKNRNLNDLNCKQAALLREAERLLRTLTSA